MKKDNKFYKACEKNVAESMRKIDGKIGLESIVFFAWKCYEYADNYDEIKDFCDGIKRI